MRSTCRSSIGPTRARYLERLRRNLAAVGGMPNRRLASAGAEPGGVNVPPDQEAGHAAGGNALVALGDLEVEQLQPCTSLSVASTLTQGTDEARAQVVQLDMGADRRLGVVDRAGDGFDGCLLGQCEHPRRRHDRHVAATEGRGGVRLADDHVEHGARAWFGCQCGHRPIVGPAESGG